jgi:hypothetical protein
MPSVQFLYFLYSFISVGQLCGKKEHYLKINVPCHKLTSLGSRMLLPLEESPALEDDPATSAFSSGELPELQQSS